MFWISVHTNFMGSTNFGPVLAYFLALTFLEGCKNLRFFIQSYILIGFLENFLTIQLHIMNCRLFGTQYLFLSA